MTDRPLPPSLLQCLSAAVTVHQNAIRKVGRPPEPCVDARTPPSHPDGVRAELNLLAKHARAGDRDALRQFLVRGHHELDRIHKERVGDVIARLRLLLQNLGALPS